jgi:hypothetical protein
MLLGSHVGAQYSCMCLPLDYKREGTQRYNDRLSSTQTYAHTHTHYSIHNGGKVLRSGGLNHSKPLCVHPSSNRQAKRLSPLLILGLGRVRSATRPEDFLSDRLVG